MIQDELGIVSVEDLLCNEKLKLSIPIYQRPYRWSTESANTLFSDIVKAFEQHKVAEQNKSFELNNDNEHLDDEYRIGTVILHKEFKRHRTSFRIINCLRTRYRLRTRCRSIYSGRFCSRFSVSDITYNIVDGQQRLTTLAILIHILKDKLKCKTPVTCNLLEEKYSPLSYNSIISNKRCLENNIHKIQNNEDSFYDFLLKKCTFVKIVTENLDEAFQFFDSQNSRGKALAPHDLLKAYHLREMNDEAEFLKKQIINKWESRDQSELSSLFSDTLFPLICWYKQKSGLYYSSKDIKQFKGVKADGSKFNFLTFNIAANSYIEELNCTLPALGVINVDSLFCQFQITQPIIAGKRFFLYVDHYLNLKAKINKRLESFVSSELTADEKPNFNSVFYKKSAGYRYVKILFINSLIFFADRFSLEELTSQRIKMLFIWAYSLRVALASLRIESINKYALGKQDKVNLNLNLFYKIAEFNSPSDLDMILLDDIKTLENKAKFDDLKNLIKILSGIENNNIKK